MVVRRAQSDVCVTESWLVAAVMLTDCDCEIENAVCTNTALPVWEEVPSDRARHSTAAGFLLPLTPRLSSPCLPFSSLLFNNPGNLNRWKRVSKPAASTQIEVLSCMVIRPRHENGSVLFLPEPRLPSSSSSRQRVVWTPVESTAKISVAPRKGRVPGWRG